VAAALVPCGRAALWAGTESVVAEELEPNCCHVSFLIISSRNSAFFFVLLFGYVFWLFFTLVLVEFVIVGQ
jgi:hypothetical protein